MPSTYKTPGVYIEEISTLPASVAQVETAIPAFIGFTAAALKNGQPLSFKPTRIESLLEYEAYFGAGPSSLEIGVNLNGDNSVSSVEFDATFCLYDSMRIFFSNGGGPCYIVSVGGYDADPADYFDDLEKGLNTLRKEDEPTLILFPDAVNLEGATPALLGTLQKSALKQCNDLQDRFCIFDLLNGSTELDDDSSGATPDDAFRNNIGVQYLKYGSSYYPNLKTTLSFDFGFENIGDIKKNGSIVSLNTLSQDPTFVEHMQAVMADKGNFATFTYGNPDIAFTGTALLNETRFETESIYNGFELIPDEYETATKGKNQVKAKVEYLLFMMQSFIELSISDITDEDNDPATNKHLKAAHEQLIKPTGSKVADLMDTLYFYDASYNTKGNTATAAEADGTKLAIVVRDGDGEIKISGNNYPLTLIDDAAITNNSIYGGATSGSAAVKAKLLAEASKDAFQRLFEEVASIYRTFEAEIALRSANLETLIRETNPIYNNIVEAIKKEGIVLPPSGAIAGIYAATDNERGVWVAPANRSLNSVVGPKINITATDQEGLNVDVVAGKSINAIRSFTGKGTLVWGARTLAGNSNEWRYIPVRRLFNMVEESIKKATEFVVFEPNDKNTWVRTKAMIENFLNGIWQAGGLAGAKAEQAYIVKIGLGETMTAQDILEGRMIVEVHMAAVRPAEFIILRFMHKLQES